MPCIRIVLSKISEFKNQKMTKTDISKILRKFKVGLFYKMHFLIFLGLASALQIESKLTHE